MPHYIKTGYWDKLSKAPKEYLNLDLLIESLAPPPPVPTYKVYTAVLTQSGTDAPVATVLENTIGNITWTRYNAGYYIGSSGVENFFLLPNTFVTITNNNAISSSYYAGGGRQSDNQIGVQTLDQTGQIDFNGELYIEIRVYN